MLAVVDTDYGNLMTVESHPRGFNVEERTTISKVPIKPPALMGWEFCMEVSRVSSLF
jgi:hypothetical protein